MGHVYKWKEMGQQAALKGTPETACPYAVGGAAFNWWMRGYREEFENIELHLADMDNLQKVDESK